jgi:hypothetical protein
MFNPAKLSSGKLLTCGNSEGTGQRALNADGYNSGTLMTIESCIAYCSGKGYYFAGVEFSAECCKYLVALFSNHFHSLRHSPDTAEQIVATFLPLDPWVHPLQTVQCLAQERPLSPAEALIV